MSCLASAEPAAKKADIQTWTAISGHQIEAEFVEIKNEELILKGDDNAEYKVRLFMLTPADQARAKEMDEKRQKSDAQTKGAHANQLPVFTSGSEKGYHAVYTHKNFLAKMDHTGNIVVQCLEEGKPVGKPIDVYYACDYTEHRKYFTRPVISFDKFPAPTMTPKRLEYEATLKDNVKCYFAYEFIDNTIEFWSWLVDPNKIVPTTRSRMTIRFRPTHQFPVEMYVSEQKEILKPYTLVIQNNIKGAMSYPYGNATPSILNNARSMAIEGPLYGKRNVSVSLKSRSKTNITFWIYPDYAPYQGYSVFFRKENENSKSDNERMILTID